MDALFFVTRPEDAIGVASSHDLSALPAADPLRIESLSVLVALCESLGAGGRLEPVRDATCRSFPVFALGVALARRITELDTANLDHIAADWKARATESIDAEPWELACCLRDLGDAVRGAGPDERLFVLLEDRVV